MEPGRAGVDVIVVAAGSSRRMGGGDKLAASLGGRPLLGWTLRAFDAAPSVSRIVLVTAPERIADLEAAAWRPEKAVAIVPGGTHRGASVAAGLRALDALDGPDRAGDGSPALDGDPVVLVHDGARPLVTTDLIEAVAAAAATHGAAIPVLPVAETVKRVVDGRVVGTVDRAELAVAQTPQGARRSRLREAFAAFPPDGPHQFTDEAALLEACRIPVHALPGDPVNLKVTVPADLALAAVALGLDAPRVGVGHDSHPFGPGTPLALGGVAIDGAPRLHGHSDGDVALHAVADALLGAAALGDLGRLFPADARTPRGIASATLVAEVCRRLTDAGLRPASIDLVIIGARPRLAAHLAGMTSTIAGLLGISPDRVNVKASTGNLAGMEGAGRGMAAHAVALVERIP